MKAIVLSDNESQRYKFLHELGMSVLTPWMCRVETQTKVFDFEVFGLIQCDEKVINFIKTRQGLIIIIDHLNVNKVIERVKYITKNVNNIPILIKIENSPVVNGVSPFDLMSGKSIIDEKVVKMFESITTNPNIKVLFYDFEAKGWFNNMMENNKNNKSKQIEKITSVTIPINEMAKKFQDCTLELELWDHYGRLRIVDYALMKHGYIDTINTNGWLCTNWRKYKTSIGHGNLWNYTLTRFWTNILYNLQAKNNYKSFNELYTSNPTIHNGKLFQKYYSNEVLFTDNAKNNWVEPNLI